MIYLLLSIACTILFFLETFCIRAISLAAEAFPLDNAEATVFTLTQNLSGARNFALSLTIEPLISASILTSLFAIGTKLLSMHSLPRYGKFLTYNKSFIILDTICSIILVHGIYTNIPVANYYSVWNNPNNTNGNTDFYTTEYIDPDSVKIEFAEKRNLILIFLESTEYNFQDSANGGLLSQNLIPEITEYIKTEQSFIPGGTQITGTGWTMADVVAKTCGIPLLYGLPRINLHSPNKAFLPGALCLTDILHEHGYTSIVSKGADLKFSRMDDFIKTHLVSEGYGRNEYTQQQQISPNVLNEWGISDSAHYALVKQHIRRLSQANKPWAVWMITLNTHTPYGAYDPACHIPDSSSKTETMLSSIRCTSRQLDDFIKWAKEQEWIKNTTIAVMGDHATMNLTHIFGFRKNEQPHYWLDFFINSTKTPKSNQRTFTSLDMFPTILEAMGAKIPGSALGFGRSLYSWAPTLIEKYGLDSLNTYLKNHKGAYSDFIFTNKTKAQLK